MIRSTVAHIDLDALQSNFRAIQAFLAADRQATPGTAHPVAPRVIAVVKANAYGHGAERVALALEAAGADHLACADIEEGIVLRRAGVTVPILVFGALSVSDLDGLFEFRLTPTVSSPGAAKAVQAAAARHHTVIGYHLKIDTGMNRLGFRHDNLGQTLPEVLAGSHLRLEGVYTHFATADDRAACRARSSTRSGNALPRPSTRCARRAGLAGTGRRSSTPRTAPPRCAIPACGTTPCGQDSCSTASCRRHWPRRFPCGQSCRSRAGWWR
jgi:alanine racemase